mgnify:CR=1 FL=1
MKKKTSHLDQALLECCERDKLEYVDRQTFVSANVDLQEFECISAVALYLIELGANPNAIGPGFDAERAHLESALFKASRTGNAELTKILLEAGADTSFQDTGYGWTPLHIAAIHADAATIRCLVAGGADLESRDADGDWTPLMNAAVASAPCPKSAERVITLLELGADANAADKSGKTPFEIAEGEFESTFAHGLIGIAQAHPISTISKLISWGSENSLCLEVPAYVSPVHVAIETGLDIELTCVLIEVGARIRSLCPYEDWVKWNEEESGNGMTPLMAAIVKDTPDYRVVKSLLEGGADPDAENDEGSTPLHLAAMHSKSLELISLLLGFGANPLTVDRLGRTPRQVACDEDVADELDAYEDIVWEKMLGK